MCLAIYWRHAYDGRRNAVNMVGSQYFDHKMLQGMPMAGVIEKLRSEHSIEPFKSFPPSAVYGAFLKKRMFPHVGFNPKTGQSVPTMRARIEARSFDWKMDSVKRAEMVLAKVWEPEHPSSLELLELD